MIGVIARPSQASIVEEFFELFKTPWEPYRPGRTYDVVVATTNDIPQVQARLLFVYGPGEKSLDASIGVAARTWRQSGAVSNQAVVLPIYCGLLAFAHDGNGIPCVSAGSEPAGVRVSGSDPIVIRVGYDLFDEVEFLLSKGQPVDQAHIPTIDIHIRMLRDWILNAGISLLEIPPIPADHTFIVCLTHDIDFVGIRDHRFDHSMWGFVYRATAGSLSRFLRRRLSLKHLLKNWLATASLPFVYAGWAADFWEPFKWYLAVEKNLPVTYFLIPFKRRAGEKVTGSHAARRATAYDIGDLSGATSVLQEHGCEIGVHGIDAWHSADKGRTELSRITAVTAKSEIGIRMHWLLRDENTPAVLEQAGYSYDSTFGYNETVGYRAGTGQVFRPLGTRSILEIPMHIQDGALFYPQRLGLSEPEAEKRCGTLIDNAKSFGGVLTLLWHDRSHGPERFWGGFYVKLLNILKSNHVWFGSAAQVVRWFQQRRQVRFESSEDMTGARTCLRHDGEAIQPPLTIRYHRPSGRRQANGSTGEQINEFVDVPWNGNSASESEVCPALSAPHTDVAFQLK